MYAAYAHHTCSRPPPNSSLLTHGQTQILPANEENQRLCSPDRGQGQFKVFLPLNLIPQSFNSLLYWAYCMTAKFSTHHSMVSLIFFSMTKESVSVIFVNPKMGDGINRGVKERKS